MFVMLDAAISFILQSFATLIDMIAKFSQSDRLRNLVEVFPTTLLMARKWLHTKRDDFQKYIVGSVTIGPSKDPSKSYWSDQTSSICSTHGNDGQMMDIIDGDL